MALLCYLILYSWNEIVTTEVLLSQLAFSLGRALSGNSVTVVSDSKASGNLPPPNWSGTCSDTHARHDTKWQLRLAKTWWLPHTPSSGRSIISLIDINDSCIDLVYLVGNLACSFMLWNFRRYLHSQYRAMMLCSCAVSYIGTMPRLQQHLHACFVALDSAGVACLCWCLENSAAKNTATSNSDLSQISIGQYRCLNRTPEPP